MNQNTCKISKKPMYILLLVLLISCNSHMKHTSVVAPFDIKKYTGTWYEIARYPHRFEKDCKCVTATYTIHKKHLRVENKCNKNGTLKVIRGKAFQIKENTGELKVRFFWPFSSLYQVILIDAQYSYAVVTNSSHQYLWILSRTPELPDEKTEKIMEFLRKNDFDTHKLIFDVQSGCNPN